MSKVEKWARIPGYPGYEVSDMGRARSYHRCVGWPNYWEIADEPQRIMAPGRDRGRAGITVKAKGGARHFRRIAYLVMLAFVGPCPGGLEVCHNNDDQTDDRLENLRYDTHQGNIDDVPRWRFGARMFDEAQVVDIRNRRAAGARPKDLAREYGCTVSTIHSVTKGETYRYWGGPLTPSKRLSEKVVVWMREKRKEGWTLKKIGRAVGRSEGSVYYICSGRNYPKAGGPLSPGLPSESTPYIR